MSKGDIRIDDGYHNLYNNSINILFDQPWNKNIKRIFPLFTRKKSWKEIEEYLKNIDYNNYYAEGLGELIKDFE